MILLTLFVREAMSNQLVIRTYIQLKINSIGGGHRTLTPFGTGF